MKKFFLLMLFLCSMSVWAQDVIVKKDGSTVACRILEVTKTEVIYKKWSDQQGSNYIVNQKDLTAIHHENGTKTTFDAAPAVPAETAPSANAQPLTDADLLKMAGAQDGTLQFEMMRKAKRLKKAGWITGGIMLAAGAVLVGVGVANSESGGYYYSYYSGAEVDWALIAPGMIAAAGGIITTTSCLVRAKNLKKKASRLFVSSAPLYQQDFKLKNGTTLSPSLDILKDNTQRNTTFGVGLTYNF